MIQKYTLHNHCVLLLLAFILNAALVSVVFGQEPQTVNDESLDNLKGYPVTVDVLANDTQGVWLASTVRIVDPNNMVTQLTSYTEPGQGTWTVNNGLITFTPQPGFDSNPFPIDYIVQDDAGQLSNPSQITITYGSGPLGITVAYFGSAMLENGAARFTWATVSENGNAGFNLFGEVGGELQKINEELIPSLVVDSVLSQFYEYERSVNGTTFYLQEVSISGVQRIFGPYELGQSYGELPDGLDSNTNIYLPTILAGSF
ncbi:MAG: hypothetical protein H6642_03220 [Caldilineaceae bacterium]|nr:hypothetical protein [Caldilineaceae bacterium]